MATVTPVARHLQLQFVAGTSSTGQPKLKSHNYPHVSPNAADDDILAVGKALAGLSADTFYQVVRMDQDSLS